MTLKRLREVEQAATQPPWSVEDHPHRHVDHPPSVTVEDNEGNELFDTLNRGYKVSMLDRLDDDSGDWHDTAGMKDLECAAAARNHFKALLDCAITLAHAQQYVHNLCCTEQHDPACVAYARVLAALEAVPE